MGIFKVPRITTEQRTPLTLEPAEIVFDSDLKTYFGGDGTTIGGFPIGTGASSSTRATEQIVVTQQNVDDMQITLSHEVFNKEASHLSFEGGLPQIYGENYTIQGKKVNFIGFSGILMEGDVVIVTYETTDLFGPIENREKIVLTPQQIANKAIILEQTPSNPYYVEVLPAGGLQQIYGLDYIVSDNILSWNNLGLDNFFQSGDTVIVTY